MNTETIKAAHAARIIEVAAINDSYFLTRTNAANRKATIALLNAGMNHGEAQSLVSGWAVELRAKLGVGLRGERR